MVACWRGGDGGRRPPKHYALIQATRAVPATPASAARSEMLFEDLKLFVGQFTEHRCLLDMQLTRQKRSNDREIMMRPRLPHLPDRLSTVLGKIIAQRLQRKLAQLGARTNRPTRTALPAGSKLTVGFPNHRHSLRSVEILKEGEVAVVKEGLEIARVTEPGAVFGELSVLLDQPHTADVRALETSQFHVADAATILRVDPMALLYVATVLAQRLDSANRGLLELKRQVQAGEPRSVIGRTVEKIEGLLGASGANLVYAGYPYDPFARCTEELKRKRCCQAAALSAADR